MENAVIPEIIIYTYLKYFLNILKESVNFSTTESIIEEVFKGVEPIGNFDPVREARKIFSNDDSLYIKFGFNINSAELPAIHIILPDENIAWEGIGWNEEIIANEDNTSTRQGEINFDTNYNLIIVDKNSDSVIFIYHVLRYLFIAFHNELELDGFQTLKISGRDLIQQQGLIPVDVYSRNLVLGFKYVRQFYGLKNLERFGHSMIVREKQIDMEAKQQDINVDKVLDENL